MEGQKLPERSKLTLGGGLYVTQETVSAAKTGLRDEPLEGKNDHFEVLGPKM